MQQKRCITSMSHVTLLQIITPVDKTDHHRFFIDSSDTGKARDMKDTIDGRTL
jgi:hypothetical protein